MYRTSLSNPRHLQPKVVVSASRKVQNWTMSDDFKPGLEGVIAFESQIAEPDKEGSALRYRGVDIDDLVGRVTFGNVWGLLVDDQFNP